MNFESLLAPRIQLAEERPIDGNDYNEYLCSSSELLANTPDFGVAKGSNSSAIIFVAEHSPLPGTKYDEECMSWTSQAHASAAHLIRNKIEEVEQKSFELILSDYLNEILLKLEPRLKLWTENAGACHSLAYLVHQINNETTGEYLGKLLPYILRWSDSWMMRPRLLAARMLDRILDIPSSCFTKFGRDKVIYDALVKALSSQDACVLQVSMSPLRKVLEMTCRDEDKTCVSMIDQFMSKLLTSIDLETKISKKNLKVELLASTWDLLEEAAYRWIPRVSVLTVAELDLVSSFTARLLLELWRRVCHLYPAPAARESKVIFPALVQAIWKISNGYFGSDNGVEMDAVILTLSKQIHVDDHTFVLYTQAMQTVTKNQRFLQALETAKSLS